MVRDRGGVSELHFCSLGQMGWGGDWIAGSTIEPWMASAVGFQ